MIDKETALAARAAMQRAARFGIGPVAEATLASMEKVLQGLGADTSSCPDRDHPRNRISWPDDHDEDRHREDPAGGHPDA